MKLQRLTALDISILAKEIGNLIIGKTIEEIRQKSDGIYFYFDDICIGLKIFGNNPYFVLDKSPISGRPWFSRLFGSRVENVNQVNFDRLICIEFSTRDRLGQRKMANLIFEFFKSGNIILTDEAEILQGSLRANDSNPTGVKYEVSPISGFNALSHSDNKILSADEIEQISKTNLLQYMNPAELLDDKVLHTIRELQNSPSPHLIKNSKGIVSGFSVYGPPFKDDFIGEKANSLLTAITEYLETIARIKTGDDSQPDISRLLKKTLAKYDSIKADILEAANYKRYRQFGEIILANLHNIQKGESLIRRVNPYSGSDDFVEIVLEPSLTPEMNASKYFDKARKLETSITKLNLRLSKQGLEVSRLRKLAEMPPSDSPDIQSVKPESVKKQRISLPFRQLKLPNGWEVFVGKSATGNDELTFSFAKKDDFWFHAWQAAGSHVLLRRPHKGDIPDKQTLLKAASLAAHYSKARTSGKVPVIYTEVRYVRKIKGAAGKVSVTSEKQLMVKPLEPDKLIE